MSRIKTSYFSYTISNFDLKKKNREKRLENEPTEGTSQSVRLGNFKLECNKMNVRVSTFNILFVIHNNTIIK